MPDLKDIVLITMFRNQKTYFTMKKQFYSDLDFLSLFTSQVEGYSMS